MKEPRLINGQTTIRYITEFLIFIAFLLLISLWIIKEFINSFNSTVESTSSLEPIFLVFSPTYSLLASGLGLLISAIYLATFMLRKTLNIENNKLSKNIDKIFISLIVIIIILIIPISIGGHFLNKYQITQKGYYYCGSLRLKDRFYRAFVLEEENFYDDHLQRIMLQYGKNNQLILEEAHNYLRGQKMAQTTGG